MNFLTAIRSWVLGGAVAVLSLAASADTTTYYHNDLLGSPLAATNAAQQVIWRETYRPYGERQQLEAGSAANEIWFTGRKEDARTELVYMGARYYDPRIGRFLQPDPVGFSEANIHSFNRYAYANNNPYRYKDPDGRRGVLVVGEISFKVAEYLGARALGSLIGVGLANGIDSLVGRNDGLARPMMNEASTESEDKPSLVDEKGAKHILDGDKEGGGHRNGTGRPGKSEFPSSWSDEKVLGEVSDVATDPQSSRRRVPGGREVAEGTRDGVDIRTVSEPNGRIVTGYPTNTPRNPPR